MTTPGLPERLYRADAVRELERRAVARMQLTAGDLMERAGAAAFQLLRNKWPDQRRLLVLCGGGNNGRPLFNRPLCFCVHEMIIIHPAWPERFGLWSVAAFAQQIGVRLVQSADKRRLKLVAK